MRSFGDVLLYLRKRADISQADLGSAIGVAKSTISMYENGERKPSFEMLEALADHFNVDMDFLTGKSEIERRHSFSPTAPPSGFQSMPATDSAVPLVGDIACGSPILAETNIRSYIASPSSWRADFALECHGDSMAPKILDGDVVAIRKVGQIENGQIAAVRIDDDATLKRLYHYPDKLILQAENPAYEPIVLLESDMERVTIEGLAVGIMRNI